MTDLERQLRQYTEAAFASVPETTAAEVMVDDPREVADPRGAVAVSLGDRRPLPGARRRWPVAVAAALVLALVGVAVVVVDGDDDASRVGTAGRREPVTTGTDTDPVPSAAGEWTVDLGGEIPYAPVVVDGAVVVVTMSDDFSQSTVIALEEDGGEQDPTVAARRWSLDLGSPVVSRPIAARDMVLLRLGNDRLVAVGADDGVVRWSAQTGASDMSPPPVVSGGTAFVGSVDGLVQAVRLQDGTLRWSRDLEGGVTAPPTPTARELLVVTTEMPLFSGGSTVYVLDAQGRVVERESASLPALTSPAGQGGIVAFTTFQRDLHTTLPRPPTQLVIGGRRGTVRHRFVGNLGAPVVTPGFVAAVSDEGVLRAYDTSDPDRQLWSVEVGANQGPQLMARGGRLIVTGANLVAVDPTNGDERWRAAVPDAFFGESDDPDRVVAVSRRGSLAVVDVRDGSLVVDFALHDTPAGAVLHDGTLVWTGSGGVVTTARIG